MPSPSGWRRLAPSASVAGPACRRVGVGVPGLYYPATGATKFLVNLPGDVGRPAGRREGRLRALGLPTHLINDARAFGLAELRLGAGRGAESMVGLSMGTGVGGVVAVHGQVLQGHDGTAGEMGHQTIDPDGPPCSCGNHGCLEAFVRADRIAEACGASSPAEAEDAGARRRRAVRSKACSRWVDHLGIGIGNTIVSVTPDRVVIGGGVAGGAGPAAADDLGRAPAARSRDVARRGRDRARPAGHVGRRDRRGHPRRGNGDGGGLMRVTGRLVLTDRVVGRPDRDRRRNDHRRSSPTSPSFPRRRTSRPASWTSTFTAGAATARWATRPR